MVCGSGELADNSKMPEIKFSGSHAAPSDQWALSGGPQEHPPLSAAVQILSPSNISVKFIPPCWVNNGEPFAQKLN